MFQREVVPLKEFNPMSRMKKAKSIPSESIKEVGVIPANNNGSRLMVESSQKNDLKLGC